MYDFFVLFLLTKQQTIKQRRNTEQHIYVIHVSFHVCRYKSYSVDTEGRLGNGRLNFQENSIDLCFMRVKLNNIMCVNVKNLKTEIKHKSPS